MSGRHRAHVRTFAHQPRRHVAVVARIGVGIQRGQSQHRHTGLHQRLDPAHQFMVRAAFEIESKADIDAVLAEMVECTASGKKISKDKWMAFNQDYEHYRHKIREFSDILDSSMTNCAAWLDVMKDQVDALLDNVELKK